MIKTKCAAILSMVNDYRACMCVSEYIVYNKNVKEGYYPPAMMSLHLAVAMCMYSWSYKFGHWLAREFFFSH